MRIPINGRHPEPRKIARACAALRKGDVIAYPTDTVYGLGCDITNKRAVEALYRMKQMERTQLLSFICPDLSDIAKYGVVDDAAYRIMRRLVPGAYTFVLPATREVPKVLRMNRKTVGIRVPDHPVALALAKELGNPVASTSASFDGEPLVDPEDIEERFPDLAMVLDTEDGYGLTPSTILDLSDSSRPVVLREGAGPVDFL